MKKTKRLILNKQSIRNLTESRIAKVAGGATLNCTAPTTTTSMEGYVCFGLSAGNDCRRISIEGTGCP